MKANILPFLVPPAIGFVLGTAGIDPTDWQLYAVLALAAAGHFAGYFQGWTDHVKRSREIDAIRKRMCKRGMCPHEDGST